jgi:hypothetical protein
MAAALRDQLIGAWKLISYEEQPVDGSPSFYPMSEKAMGIIMYTPDGFMSAQFMAPDRKLFASGDWFQGTDEEYRQAATTYAAYSGPFHVDEEKKIVTHSMFVTIFPNWIGQTQPRAVRIEGDDLYLSSLSPFHLRGRTVNAQLHWKRANKA